jgi:hypothetical protein
LTLAYPDTVTLNLNANLEKIGIKNAKTVGGDRKIPMSVVV